MFDLFRRQNELKRIFQIGRDVTCEDSLLDIRFFPFTSTFQIENEGHCINNFSLEDKKITENYQFLYPVFKPNYRQKTNKAILLLHGLNERSWDKYLSWAEFLCLYTQRPVVLFPMAFHMNRSETSWLNLRSWFNFLNVRRDKIKNDNALSIANVVLSDRLTENPIRFYTSGKQTIQDLTLLVKELKSGDHPCFEEDCQIDIFAYSIGAMITQIALMVNSESLFSNSRAFLFCGGSLFNYMNGLSKNIMDQACYESLLGYYTDRSWLQQAIEKRKDIIFRSFASLIVEDINRDYRYGFFNDLGDRMKIIALEKDIVIPYKGIEAAVGERYANHHMLKIDFNYVYSHEQPFPVNNIFNKDVINDSFNRTFTIIGDFFNSQQ